MKKAIIFLITLALIYAGINYTINVFLPKKIDAAVKSFIEEKLKKDISISQTTVSLIRGISFKDVTVYEKDKKDIYLHADKITLRPIYSAFIYVKKIILKAYVQDAYFKITRSQKGEFDLPTIQTDSKEPGIFFLKNISAKNVTIDFEDQIYDFKKKMTGIDIKASVSLRGIADLETKWQKYLFLTARYNIKAKSLKGVVTLNNIGLAQFNPFLKNITIKDASLSDATFSFEGNKEYIIKGNARINNISLAKDGLDLKGDLEISPILTFYKDKNDFEYTLNGRLHNATIKGIPHIGSLSNSTAIFSLDKKSLIVSSLKTQIYDKIVSLSSKIDYSNYPDYSLSARSSLPLAQLIYLAKKIRPFSFDYDKEGDIALALSLKGNIEKQEADYLLNYDIRGASFNYLDQISAKGYLKKDSLVITEGLFHYKDIPFDLEAKLNDFSSPKVSFNIKNDPFNLKADAVCAKDNIDINQIMITAAQTDIKASAQIASKKDPMVIIEGKGTATFADIKKGIELFKLDSSLFDRLKLQGRSNINFTVNGNSDISLWQIKLTAQSDRLKIYGLEGQNVTVELYRDEDEIIIDPLTAKLAEGKIQCLAKLNPSANTAQANVIANDVDLSYIRENLELEDSHLSGKLSLETFIKSDDLKNFSRLDGEGVIEVKEGNIWEISFFEGLGKFLFIPDFEKIRFQEGYSDIFFQGKDIIFENLELDSRKMELSGAGKITLDGNIHFMFFPQFNPRIVALSEGLKKITTEFLGKSGLVIEVQGTLKEPTYEMKPLFLSPLDKIKDFFENISG